MTGSNPGEERESIPGNQIRQYRIQRGLSVRELAARAQVSPSLISQIENRRTDPSISSLRRIAEALDVSIFYLLDPDGHRRRNSQIEEMIVRRGARRRVVLPEAGLEYELLCPDVDRQLEVWIGRLDVGQATSDEPRGHGGEEVMLVLSGQMELQYGSETVVLGPEDSVYLSGPVPHRHRAIGDEPLVFLSALTPPVL